MVGGCRGATTALIQVGRHTDLTTRRWRDVTILVGCIAVALVLASATLRRRNT
jgi:ABC-2 type transport system permease protein